MKSLRPRLLAVTLLPLVVPLLNAADADVILTDGKIITCDNQNSIVQAIAVKNGRITLTGTSAGVLASERGAHTRVIDLKGKTVVPGLTDAHVHAIEAGLSEY